MSLLPEDPTTSAALRPADAARQALRAARRRMDAEREQARDGEEPTPAGTAAGARGEQARGGAGTEGAEETPADMVHRVLKEARERSKAGRAPDSGTAGEDSAGATQAPAGRGDAEAWPKSAAVPRPATVPADATTPDPDETPATRAAGGRPADLAREALRAARREAVLALAEAEADAAERGAARGGRTAQPRTRRGAPAPGGAVAPVSRTASEPGEDSRATRTKAVQDMRHYLANAFRMPTWSDTPDEETRPSDTSADAGDHSHSEPQPTAPVSTADADATHPSPTSAATDPDHPAPAPASAHPYLPATMATPHRDTELRRTFPAFAARAAADGGVTFAGTWWGNAWAEALEQGALDAKRLARGRSYAGQGHVDAITVTPGLVLAYVRGSRPRPYRVQVRLRTLADEDWERFLDAAADRPGHIAALLDNELPQSLADCGVPLLPGPGDLDPQCSCPDSGHPCKHAAALCYQTARLLDADPFVLLLLRGRGEKDLLDALSRRNAARAARAAQERQADSLPGVRATDALAARRLPPLPPPMPVPPHSGPPPVYPAAPGGPDPFALDQLATDAAARAHALLDTGRDPVGELTLWQDAVRLAAARPGSGLTAATRTLYATLATAVGRTASDLARAVAAWRQGASAGLAALEEPWDPPAGRFDRARPLLLAADLPAFRPWRNRLTHPQGHAQLRLGRDGLWYAYESEPGRDDWWPRGTPDLDPVGALTGLGTPDGL
ncbi:SWIM zinc finger family protein [Streptomyces monashensis]|uniref:SWIM zinc finger family protein n=1 Tax=Streptomyces monashensis TaxID=1678012 RepID=UPI00340BA258